MLWECGEEEREQLREGGEGGWVWEERGERRKWDAGVSVGVMRGRKGAEEKECRGGRRHKGRKKRPEEKVEIDGRIMTERMKKR